MRWFLIISICLILSSAILAWKDFDLRFENDKLTGGIVKIYHDGRWLPICTPFPMFVGPLSHSTDVMCKSMGFSAAIHEHDKEFDHKYMGWKKNRKPQKGEKALELRHMRCRGNELNIKQCPGFVTRLMDARHCPFPVKIQCKGERKRTQNPVEVGCEKNRFNVSIDVKQFHKYFTDVDPDKLTLVDKRCSLKLLKGRISVLVPFGKCGTVVKETDTAILYTNHLTYTDASGSRTKLQTLTCSMSRQMQVKQSVKAVPDSVMVVTGHGNFLVSMDVYKDTTFKTKKVGPIITRPGVVLYLKLELKSSSTDGLNIVAQDCHSTPSLDSTQTTPLISDRCPAEKSIKLIQSTKPTNQVLMSVKTQALKNVDSDVVYIVCNVTICQDSDRSRRCRQECSGSNNRTKREAEFELPSASLYKGPFVVVPQNQQQEILESPWILSIAGVGILTVGVIVGSLRRKSKHI